MSLQFNSALYLCKMRGLIICGFVFLFLSKLMYSCVWQIHFYLNQQEITEMECENKNRPEMHCSGKCFLAKKLKLADEQLQNKKDKQSHSLQKIKSLEETDLSVNLIESLVLHGTCIIVVKNPMIVRDHYSYQHFTSVFHPPCNV
jgi:hypothetical protein